MQHVHADCINRWLATRVKEALGSKGEGIVDLTQIKTCDICRGELDIPQSLDVLKDMCRVKLKSTPLSNTKKEYLAVFKQSALQVGAADFPATADLIS